MLSILALICFALGLVVFYATEKSPDKAVLREVARMFMWCGFLVLLAMAAGWHAHAL